MIKSSPVGTAELSPGRSPGLATALKSPVGTTEKVIEMVQNSGSRAGIVNRETFRDVRATASRPYGTFRRSNPYPGLRPGLSSAVPAGLSLQSPTSHAHTLLIPAKLESVSVRFHLISKSALYQCTTSVVPQKSQMPRALAPAALFPSRFGFGDRSALQPASRTLPLQESIASEIQLLCCPCKIDVGHPTNQEAV